MSSLIQLTKDYYKVLSLIDSVPEGQEVPEEVQLALEEVASQIPSKLEGVGFFLQSLDAEEEQAKNLKKVAEQKIKSVNRTREFFEACVKAVLSNADDEQIQAGAFLVRFKATQQVRVDDVQELPEAFQRRKVTVEADKEKLKEVLKSGSPVKGAYLVDVKRVEFKPLKRS